MFLPQPQSATSIFEKPRTTLVSDSGLKYARYSGTGYWKGSITYEPQRDPFPLLALLQQADKSGGFFYADLYEPGKHVLPDPIWRATTAPFATHFFMFPVAEQPAPRKGDIIALRASVAIEFITARQVVEVSPQSNGSVEVRFNEPIPAEFLTQAFASELQVCYNRPHCRAVFDKDTLRYTTNEDRFAQISTLSWREDTAANLGVLTRLQDTSDTADDIIIAAENGDVPQAVNGDFLAADQ